MPESVHSMLDRLAELRAAPDAIRLQKQALIDTVLTDEIKAKLAEIDAEFAEPLRVANEAAAELEAEIKQAVLFQGATVKGEQLQAVYVKGRVSWDTKSLDGYAAAHPEIAVFRKEGAPSVTIRS